MKTKDVTAMGRAITGWKFETLDGENGFEFEIEGGSDAVKKLTDIMETVEQDMKARTLQGI